MITKNLDIRTPDGTCDSFVAYPSETGSFPAVLLYMDAFGIRTYLNSMAKKLASSGYYVLVPNLLYRIKRSPVVDAKFPLKAEDMPEIFKQLMPMFQKFSPTQSLEDGAVFFDFLAKQKQVRKGKVGITGYCMGGSMALRTAAKYPDKVAAAACFHGGNLANDAADSPHKTIGQAKTELYIANADNDKSMPVEQIERLRSQLDLTQVRYEMETYTGAAHGFTMEDLPAYNEGALKKHWDKLLALFKRTLMPE